MKRSLSLVVVVLALSACTSDRFGSVGVDGVGGQTSSTTSATGTGGTGTGTSTGGAAPAPEANPACGAGAFGETLLGCDLYPETAVIAVDASNIYYIDLSTPGLNVYLMSRADFSVTRIHTGDRPWSSNGFADRVGDWYPLHQGKLYVDVRLNKWNEAYIGKKLVELDPATGATRDVVDGPADNTWALDGDSIYWQQHKIGGPIGALAKTNLTTKQTVVLDPDGGFVWGLAVGHVYYARYTPPAAGEYAPTYQLYRIPVSGGQPEFLVNIGAISRHHDTAAKLAVDVDGSVYFVSMKSSPWTIDRVVPGGARETFAPWPDGAWGMHLEGDDLYFWGVSTVQRMAKQSGAKPEQVFGPADPNADTYMPTAPVLDGSTLFTAYVFEAPGKPNTGRITVTTIP